MINVPNNKNEEEKPEVLYKMFTKLQKIILLI